MRLSNKREYSSHITTEVSRDNMLQCSKADPAISNAFMDRTRRNKCKQLREIYKDLVKKKMQTLSIDFNFLRSGVSRRCNVN